MSDNRDLVSTIFFRLLGLLFSFGIVILSTQLLGATGRGYISLLIADSALIAILTNILSGSSAMFHMHKFDEGKVFTTAMIWILFSSLLCFAFSLSYLFTSSIAFNHAHTHSRMLGIKVIP